MKMKLHFWELSPNTYFRLSNHFWGRILLLRKESKLGWKRLRDKAKIDFGNIDDYAEGRQMVPLLNLLKLYRFIRSQLGDLSLQSMEGEITEIRSGKHGKIVGFPNLPINLLDYRWGALVGAVRSEGTIRKTKDGLLITNTDVEYLEKLKNSIDGILGRLNLEIKPYSRTPNGGTRKAYYLSLSFIFSDILMRGLKLDPGNKIQIDAALPKLYLSLSTKNPSHVKTVAALLRWLFSGDGWITVFRDHLGQTHRVIGISFSKSMKNPADRRPPKLLLQTAYLIEKFFGIGFNGPYLDKVYSYMTPNGKRTTAQWKIFIRGYSNLKKFYENIGFVENWKNELLNHALNSYQRPKLGDGENLKLVAKMVREMKCATAPGIAKKTKLSLSWTERLLKRGTKEGHLGVISGGKGRKNGGRTPYVYEWVGG